MLRKIIKIDENLCDGCALCANVCRESAITIRGGKAKLTRDDYCDGLGDCLCVCPTAAISFEERETAEFDEEAARAHLAKKSAEPQTELLARGCPSSHSRSLKEKPRGATIQTAVNSAARSRSKLAQWPVQIKLAPRKAAYFDGAELLIAADCCAYASANFHADFMSGKTTLIGCPKLDSGNYAEKLAAILSGNEIKNVTIARMEVPCCGGIVEAALEAARRSGKDIPCRAVTISLNGEVL
ncbi:MAG: 4Fe-4S binding protein [Helicobacteraceae bacterium]|nr:4Fe-4S binding protein [Helicobacteraceae bacterium]